jgi:DNA-binding NtrC family response regulator
MSKSDPPTKPRIAIDTFNLDTVERRLCELALANTGSIGRAAEALGISRHALRRRIILHKINWSIELEPGEEDGVHEEGPPGESDDNRD